MGVQKSENAGEVARVHIFVGSKRGGEKKKKKEKKKVRAPTIVSWMAIRGERENIAITNSRGEKGRDVICPLHLFSACVGGGEKKGGGKGKELIRMLESAILVLRDKETA